METRLTEVRRILNAVVGNRMPNHSGKGKFWNLSRNDFVAAIVRGLPVVVPGDPAASGLIKAIRGTDPFDRPPLYRMPRNGPYVSDADITFIEGWIRDGAPDVDARARRPQIAELTAELAMAKPGKHGEECLKRSVRAAIALEFATVPPYLTAMWSIKTDPSSVASTLYSVVIEEMSHMGLACNMLVGLGESPALASAEFVPTYPGPLPGEVNPSLEVTLRRLTPEQLKTFMDIEFPEGGPITLKAGRSFDTIGAFYAELREAFERVNPSLDTTYQRDGVLSLTKLVTVQNVCDAIDLIRRQGEGSKEDQSPNDPEGGLAHFYQFREIYVGAEYKPDPVTGIYSHRGPPVVFPEVLPVADIPPGGYQRAEVPDASVWANIEAFDCTFSTMLRQLETAWRDAGANLQDAIDSMFELSRLAGLLLDKPRPDGRGNYGPCFRLV